MVGGKDSGQGGVRRSDGWKERPHFSRKKRARNGAPESVSPQKRATRARPPCEWREQKTRSEGGATCPSTRRSPLSDVIPNAAPAAEEPCDTCRHLCCQQDFHDARCVESHPLPLRNFLGSGCILAARMGHSQWEWRGKKSKIARMGHPPGISSDQRLEMVGRKDSGQGGVKGNDG